MTDMILMGSFRFKLALALHITGVFGMFGAVALQILTVFMLRNASSVGQVRVATGIARRLPGIFGPSSALIVLSGLYLGYLDLSSHEEIGWIIVSLVMFVVIALTGSIMGRQLSVALRVELDKSGGNMTDGLKKITRSNRPITHVSVSVFGLLGILVLMIFQPPTVLAIIILIIAVLLGLAAAIVLGLSNRTDFGGFGIT